MNLVASRALWHLYGEGLVIPFANEGLRKYSQEYTSPGEGFQSSTIAAGAFWDPPRPRCTSRGTVPTKQP